VRDVNLRAERGKEKKRLRASALTLESEQKIKRGWSKEEADETAVKGVLCKTRLAPGNGGRNLNP